MKSVRRKVRKVRKTRKYGHELTAREIEMLQYRTRYSPQSIAEHCGLTLFTVQDHMRSIREKFGISDIAIVLLEASKRGLITY